MKKNVNEVIEGLTCCSANYHDNPDQDPNCEECPYSKFEDDATCIPTLCHDALTFLKAAIENDDE